MNEKETKIDSGLLRRRSWGWLLFVFIGGEVVMHLWNWLLPPLFGWRQITFWQALGLSGAVPDPLRRTWLLRVVLAPIFAVAWKSAWPSAGSR